VLGHRRLAIIDLSQGHQPMATGEGKLWITFNGEIYNYRPLRDELRAKGYEFRTNSDTEVILNAYREWGDRCPERLEGMFAFALLDTMERRLFMARDHLGKKPLYFRWRGQLLDFASEISVLRQAADWKGELDSTALAFYLRLGYVPSPFSIYQDVEKLRPGECAVVDSRGVHRRKFWDVPPPGSERDMTLAGAVEAVESELKAAVEARLMSEVPLGAFLSGGIDSSLVVGMMADIMGPGVKTVTIGFLGHPDETEAARLAAQHNRTDHAEYRMEADPHGLMGAMVEHFGEPFADCSALPTWHVSREARKRVTVVLTGDGGDESFGGYDFRYAPHCRDAALRRWLPGRTPFRVLAGIWPRRHDLRRWLQIGNVLRNLGMDEDEAFYHDLCFTAPSLADSLAPHLTAAGRDVEEHVRALYRSGRGHDPLQAIMRADVKLYLPEDVLVKVDRMSMAHGIEVRSPLLSKRIVELAFSIPADLKTRKGSSKRLLRKVAERHVPRELWALPKHGFQIPLDRWLRNELRAAFQDDVLVAGSAAAEHLDTAVVRRVWTEHQAGSVNHGYTLWAIWVLSTWAASVRDRKPRSLVHADLPRVG
jgi:asparagine synthase (glutamine-hydrolysing)